MLEKHDKLQPKSQTTDELKAVIQTILKELPQENVNKAMANFDNHLTTSSTWLWLTIMVTSNICSNSVHPQVCILLSSPTNRLFTEPPTD